MYKVVHSILKSCLIEIMKIAKWKCPDVLVKNSPSFFKAAQQLLFKFVCSTYLFILCHIYEFLIEMRSYSKVNLEVDRANT